MKTILMVCDAQDRKLALLEKAVNVAKSYQAKLHILDIVYVRDLSGLAGVNAAHVDKFIKQSIKQRQAEIKAALAEKNVDSKSVKIHVLWSKNLAAETASLCKEIVPELVIKRASINNNKVLYTPVDWQLIEHCPSPLLISPMKSFKKQPKVLVALDLGTKLKSKIALNDRLAAEGKRLADNTGAELHFACCVAVSAILKELDMIDYSTELRKLKEKTKPLLAEFQQKYDVPNNQVHFKVGTPAKVINSISQKLKADCIVLGTIGRRGVKARFLGSTSEQILNYLHTDMLLLRP